ncbi:DUF998 domain-containing protein [Spongiactinospora rosea]|uniref:DUF998 domain-containing protein n=1 Tax=Spongiactinospora rosea TaxID=2248750 RepID=A0A366M7D4_9ACTN|nr:DUF998 domain-containing protein [Spongiactinospora rosea]RBQ21372.1 DUF998 domain-containing protein [Spongiactinospora rosea]
MLLVRGIYPLIACLGVVAAVVAMAVGLLDTDPRLDAFGMTIGEYAVVSEGVTTEFGMLSLGVAAVALLAGLRATGAPVQGTPGWLIGAWGGVMMAAAFVLPMLDGWTGEARRIASIMSVMSLAVLPAAAGLLVSRFAADERWRVIARPVEWLALAGGFGLLATTYAALPGDGALIGLVERVMLAVGIAFLGVLALRLVTLGGAGRRIAVRLREAYAGLAVRVDLAKPVKLVRSAGSIDDRGPV